MSVDVIRYRREIGMRGAFNGSRTDLEECLWGADHAVGRARRIIAADGAVTRSFRRRLQRAPPRRVREAGVGFSSGER